MKTLLLSISLLCAACGRTQYRTVYVPAGSPKLKAQQEEVLRRIDDIETQQYIDAMNQSLQQSANQLQLELLMWQWR